MATGQMRVRVESLGNSTQFRATGEASGVTIRVDVTRDQGQEPQGPKPMELLSMSLATCMATNVVDILNKKRIPFDSVRVDAEADRAEEAPRRFTALHVRCVVQSSSLEAEVLDQVLELAAKHCPAHETLTHGLSISAVGTIER